MPHGKFLLSFHDQELLDEARANLAPGELALVAPESSPLEGLARVIEHVVRRVQQLRPVDVATLEMDATIIESHKRQAEPHYKGGRG